MKAILPALGVVTATEPAQYLLTPFQDGTKVLTAFLEGVLQRKPKRFRSMTYGTTLQPFFQHLVDFVTADIDSKNIYDHTQAMGKAEKAQLEWLVSRGYKDIERFLLGTTPLHRQINHLKAMWDSDGYLFHGSWNYSASADQQYNVIEVTHSPEIVALYDQAFDFAWDWILKNEPQYQTIK
ncbi:MAG: hypothetical protein KGL39_30065 [Patescibacteria group bacterium]|nr:hypothetical protein [Patescibacteria group bacterium]